MSDFALAFAAVDATGAGMAVLREDGTIASASRGFCELLGANEPLNGADVRALAPGLPALESLGEQLGPDSPAFVQGSFGRTRRVLAAASVRLEGARVLLLADRTQAQRSRAELRLGPDAREAPAASDTPRAARVRPMSEMGERTAHALALARRYRHDVTVIRLEVDALGEADLDGIVLGCVRGVDDVGRSGARRYLLLLPDTDVTGAKVVAQRISTKLQGVGTPSMGLAQSEDGQGAADLLDRAAAACKRAGQRRVPLVVASMTPPAAPTADDPET